MKEALFQSRTDLFKKLMVVVPLALLFLLATTITHAQAAPNTGWGPAFGGPDCYTTPSGLNLCSTASADCLSIARLYAGGPPPYDYVKRVAPAMGSGTSYSSGLACYFDYTIQRTTINPVCGTGTVGDANSPLGCSPSGVATVQNPKQIGGGDCGGIDDGCPPNDDGQPSATADSGDANSEPNKTGNHFVGEPINAPTGNMAYHKTDYTTAGQNALTFTRYFNSRGTFTGTLGSNWRSTYDRYLSLYSSTTTAAERADGQLIVFNLISGIWTPDTDVDYTLTNSGTTWTLTAPNDTVETYTKLDPGIGAPYLAELNSIKLRNGYTKNLAYNSLGQISTVTDSYGRSLTFSYTTGGDISTILTPDSTTITYGYTSTGIPTLSTVTYPTSPTQTLTYVYANSTLPQTLTGVTDEAGNTYLTWTYDAYGRALTSIVGNGATASTTTVAYNDTNGSRTVTNTLGVVNTYTYSTLQGAQKLTQISRAATATTAAATRTFTYDTRGYLASEKDWDGNQTTYVNNTHGAPTTINEAVGSTVARTTTIAYDPTWVHLPATITTPGVTATFTYDTQGEQLTRTLTDTTSTTIPYSTNGQTRVWTKTWSNYLLASLKTPNSHTTGFGYDTSGALTSITDPLTHVTHITAHTGGGLPLTVVDPNSVTTTLTYDGRQRPLTSAVSTSAGTRTTSWAYYNNGEVATTLPDGSGTLTLVDTAHRYEGIANNNNEQYLLTLDSNGDPIETLRFDGSGNLDYYRTATFDQLGRRLKDTSTVTSQSYIRTFDSNGNTLTIKDPLNHTTTQAFDALNRKYKITDANTGIAQYTFDSHNRPLTVSDPTSNTTSFVYNGFGDMIQQTSPDTGTTVYHYDSDGNLTQKVDGAAVTANYTYDSLDRQLTASYPADTAENVTLTYDQTGATYGKGIGWLTSVTDAAGTLIRTYDERGNMLTEKRTIGTSNYTTTYTYDPASRIATITYPSGTLVTYGRNAIGRVTSVATKASGYTSTPLASGVTYEPFGPATAITAFNGDSEAFAFDADYRMTSLITTATNGSQHQTFAYDNANNLHTITDTVCTSCSATYGYDTINRLTSAASWYGSYAYTYDKNGNFLTNNENGVPATYAYTAGTDRLSSITFGGTAYTVSYTGTGNISSFTRIAGETTNLTYNKANELATSSTPFQAASYGYDAFRRRSSKSDPGTTATLYFYDQAGNTIEEIAGGTSYDYVWLGGRAIGSLTPSTNTLAFLHGDKLGSPQLATDKNALIAQSYSYTPYGNTGGTYSQPGAATITQNNRLPGQFFDPETLMNHNGFRDLSTAMGQFVQADPIGLAGGLNPYRYAAASPTGNTDPTGLICASDIPGSSDESTLEDADGQPIIDPNTGKPYPLPPGMDIDNNILLAIENGPSTSDMVTWFRQGGTEDYQRPDGYLGKFDSQYRDVSNFNYGAVSAAEGETLDETLGYAGGFNMMFGHPWDVLMGRDSYLNGTGLTQSAMRNIAQGWAYSHLH